MVGEAARAGVLGRASRLSAWATRWTAPINPYVGYGVVPSSILSQVSADVELRGAENESLGAGAYNVQYP